MSAGSSFGFRLPVNFAIPLQHTTDVAEVRRAATLLARDIQLDATAAGKLALVVTEAGTNVVKHARGGIVVLSRRDDAAGPVAEMLAIDKGPGMENVPRSMTDGFSTAGSPGNGLGAIARLSTRYEVYSAPGAGTVVMAQVRNPVGARAPASPALFEIGAVCVSKPGESIPGDAWMTAESRTGLRVFVADGLGHGPAAADAAGKAIEMAAARPGDSLVDLLGRVHDALRPTRGAAVAVADIDFVRRTVLYAGLGNISGAVVRSGDARTQMVSHNGTAGHQAMRIREFSYPWDAAALVVMHSDGVTTHWSLDRYPGLYRFHPSVIASVIYRDFQRGNDDATVVVVRRAAAGATS